MHDGDSPICSLNASVTSHTTVRKGPSGYTMYVILVKCADKNLSWTVSRRFSEFQELYDSLSFKTSSLPNFPAKKWLFNLNPDFLDGRRIELDLFISQLVTINFVLSLDELSNFLKLKEHGVIYLCPSDACFDPSFPIVEFVDNEFGYNRFIFNSLDVFSASLAISVGEDANIASKVDSYVLNFKLPWEKESPRLPVGCAILWTRNSERLWKATGIRNYECPASAVVCDLVSGGFCFVGLETGIIKRYTITADQTFQIGKDVSLHNLRVTGLLLDTKRKLLLSASRDKSVILYDFADDVIVSRLTFPDDDSSIMSFEGDLAENRVFLGTTRGLVHIVDFAHGQLHVVGVLNGHDSVIRALCYEPKASFRYLFSGDFDGIVNIWKVGPRGDEGIARSVGLLKGGPPSKIKSIAFCVELMYAFVGHDCGSLAIWNTKNATLVSVVKLHTAGIVSLTWVYVTRLLLSVSRDGRSSVRNTTVLSFIDVF